MIRYHYAKGPDAIGGSRQREDIIEAAVADGFPFFKRVYPKLIQGKVFYLWNLCRVYRDIIENKRTTFFTHDGARMRFFELLGPFYAWLMDTWETLQTYSDGKALTLSTTHFWSQLIYDYDADPIPKTSGIIYPGILAPDTWGRVYTPAFAEFMLDEIEKDVDHILHQPSFQILFKYTHKEYLRVRHLPHTFSCRTGISRDTPRGLLGSDSDGNDNFDTIGYHDIWSKFFDEGSISKLYGKG